MRASASAHLSAPSLETATVLLTHTLRYMPAQLIGPMAQFASVIVWTHMLPPAGYGALALALALQELVFQLCLAWWSAYVMRYAATLGPEAAERQAAIENAVLLVSALAQVGVTWIVLAIGEVDLTPDLALAAVAYTIGRCLTTHLAERARAAHAILAYTVAQTVGPLLGFPFAFALVSWRPGATAVLAGFALAQALALPYLWRRLRLGRRLRLDAAVLKAALRYGVPLVVTGAIGWVTVNGVRVVVEHLDGPVAVGLLSVGWGLGQRLLSVAAMLVTAAAFPLAVQRMAQGGAREGYAQVARNGVLLLAVIAPSCAGVIWLTAPLVDLLIGEEFRAATRALLPVATAAAAIRNLRVHCADQVFLLAERTGFLATLNTVEAAATLGGCAVGVVTGGLYGACLGCLAGYSLGAVLGFGFALREGLRLPLLPIVKVLVATLVMVTGLGQLPAPENRLDLVTFTLFGGSLYLAALALMFSVQWLPRVRSHLRARHARETC